MEKIASFTVNHLKLERGVYVSRIDTFGNQPITSFDIRMVKPNRESVINTAEIHAIEHLGATFLRNHPVWKDKIVYFGPMGCRTGFYMLISGKYSATEILPLTIEMFEFIRDFEGIIPGACAKDCGNYLDMNLPMAKLAAKIFLEKTLYVATTNNLNYPA